jgi:penicillin-binding protein-related factor A (putative recombinase)
MVPASLKGKQFEAAIMAAGERLESAGVLTLGRYGVQGVTFGGKTILVPSLPDFEGVLRGGSQFIIEAKCCQDAALALHDDKFKARQYSHMARRARFGAKCFLLIHFAERRLKTKTDPGMTVAVPVDESMPFWELYENGFRKSLTRDDALEYGQIVPWVIPPRCRKALPDLMRFITNAGHLARKPAPQDSDT